MGIPLIKTFLFDLDETSVQNKEAKIFSVLTSLRECGINLR